LNSVFFECDGCIIACHAISQQHAGMQGKGAILGGTQDSIRVFDQCGVHITCHWYSPERRHHCNFRWSIGLRHRPYDLVVQFSHPFLTNGFSSSTPVMLLGVPSPYIMAETGGAMEGFVCLTAH